MESREKQPRNDGTGERRPEVDLVRFESSRIAGGLWRHRAVKFVFELTRPRRRTAPSLDAEAQGRGAE